MKNIWQTTKLQGVVLENRASCKQIIFVLKTGFDIDLMAAAKAHVIVIRKKTTIVFLDFECLLVFLFNF